MIIFQDAPPPAPAPRETRFATQDGYIWPVCRPDMVEPIAIADRMGEDALKLFDRDGTVEQRALKLLGWTWSQIRENGDAAQENLVRRIGARNRTRRLGAPAQAA